MDPHSGVGDLGPTLDGFRQYLCMLARHHLSPRHAGKIDPSSVVQQTFLEAIQAQDDFPSDTAQQAAWLRRALAHNLTDAERKVEGRGRGRRRHQSVERAIEESSARMDDLLASQDLTPRRQLEKKEQLACLAAALLQLPDDQRLAIELHHLQGLTLDDVGKRLGRSREAVAGLVYRGLTKLRALMAE